MAPGFALYKHVGIVRDVAVHGEAVMGFTVLLTLLTFFVGELNEKSL